jgi:glycine/D-amino acid oxidase-like deaminating enzyme
MPPLLVVGGGLFGSLAAHYARSKGLEALVFDPGLEGAASSAAAGLFKEAWVSKKLGSHYLQALPVLDRLFGIQQVALMHDDGKPEILSFVPPAAILEKAPIPRRVTAVGDGWLEAGGERFEGPVYVAAGVWSPQFLPDLRVTGKAGAAFSFAGEQAGRIRQLTHGRQAIAFVRDPGRTYFADGTAEQHYTPNHDQQTLLQAAALGLTDDPVLRSWGVRPYSPGGPIFRKLASRTWLATGGRKMGTLLGASFARRLVEAELPR